VRRRTRECNSLDRFANCVTSHKRGLAIAASTFCRSCDPCRTGEQGACHSACSTTSSSSYIRRLINDATNGRQAARSCRARVNECAGFTATSRAAACSYSDSCVWHVNCYMVLVAPKVIGLANSLTVHRDDLIAIDWSDFGVTYGS
jgi:hypothetical protein